MNSMVESENNTIVTEINTIFHSYSKEYTEELRYSTVINHIGVFTHDLINSLSVGMEEAMTAFGDKKHIIKRMFSILIEGLQNIRIHGGKDENGDQLAFLLVAKNKERYKILLGNIAEKEDRSTLKAYLGNINSHDEKELKSLYLKVLAEGYLSKKGGARLGVITMRIKSSKTLNYRLYNLPSGKTFFAVEVELDR